MEEVAWYCESKDVNRACLAVAVRSALIIALSLGCWRVLFLFDAQVLVDSLVGKSCAVHWEVLVVVDDIREVLAEERAFGILHTPSSANVYAHRLAAYGSSLSASSSFDMVSQSLGVQENSCAPPSSL
ncbi:hypothetical protein HHK36_019095 [Tetracentron sinense]|uniref:RNase H type-1 domain-containing protein n=1 Tax=Tetracentron sinense TaxID=13715 RepID=A0A834YTC1_TETSI|nr:hypothetical protein HHK36_019095 [Tetracentron sinense]